MRRLKQEFRHDPAHGVYGDCWRVCYASLLDLDLADVPHFLRDGCSDKIGGERIDEWLAGRNLRRLVMPTSGDLNGGMRNLFNLNGLLPFIVTGKGRSGVHHCVVWLGDQIYCDPSPDNIGLVGPCEDGLWWLEFVYKPINP
jgi:hypothetical protein